MIEEVSLLVVKNSWRAGCGCRGAGRSVGGKAGAVEEAPDAGHGSQEEIGKVRVLLLTHGASATRNGQRVERHCDTLAAACHHHHHYHCQHAVSPATASPPRSEADENAAPSPPAADPPKGCTRARIQPREC